jgi:hypothetical protein
MLGWLLEIICVRVNYKSVILCSVDSLELLYRADHRLAFHISKGGLARDLRQLVETTNLI